MGKIVVSPWLSTFRDFIQEDTRNLFLVAPYITAWPLNWIGEQLVSRSQPLDSIYVITSFTVNSLQSGSLSPLALREFSLSLPGASVVHIPRLHTKTYLNDQTAIVTSANLTAGGILHNVECGIKLTSAEAVAQVRQNVLSYLEIGSQISQNNLAAISECTIALQQTAKKEAASSGAANPLKILLQQQQDEAATQILSSRVTTESIESIFKRTILAVLRNYGPLPTTAIHAWVSQMQPDLCDDSVDRVINGMHFGRKWKHQVRSAQVALKRRGMIDYWEGIWRIVS